MIDLYSWPTPNGRKIQIMLEEAGLEYRAHAIDIELHSHPDFAEGPRAFAEKRTPQWQKQSRH